MSQFAFKQGLSPARRRVRSRHDSGLISVCTDRVCDQGRVASSNHGWEDITQAPNDTVIEQTVLDDTLPNGPHKKNRRYIAPFALANREADYRIAWEFFGQPNTSPAAEQR